MIFSKKTIYLILVTVLSLSLIRTGFCLVKAAEDNVIEELSQKEKEEAEIEEQIGDKERELEELESKIKSYEDLIELKHQQQATLGNQIEIMEEEIRRAETEISKADREMSLIELEIKTLELKIKEKDISIDYNRRVLKELIKTIYHNSQSSTIEILLKYESLGDFFSGEERLNQVNEKTKNVLDEINQIKFELQKQQEEKENKHDDLEELKVKNQRNKFYLESEQNAKENLLEITQGEETKYQELLGNLEAQRQTLLGDMGEMASENSGELARVRSHQKKPKSGLASTSWYYSQRDSSWAKDTIGPTSYTMGQYGCAITSVAMVLRYHGIKIDPGLLVRQVNFDNRGCIYWPSYFQGVERTSSTGHGNVDWDVIDDQLKEENPVIIFVGASGRGAGHYVVIHGKDKKGEYVVHDPYWGSNMYLDSTRENISVLYGSSTYIDQMIVYEKK
jgi:peptidoglycan hydrolase CwlO-like protein